jgi:hypothetical protein
VKCGKTGAAFTLAAATGPSRASSQHLTDSLPDRRRAMTVTCYDGSERGLNDTDDVEVGWITPPPGQHYPEKFQ